jgi:hypothetical protein
MNVGDAAIKIRDDLAGSCGRAGSPLSEDQQMLIVGGLAVWLDWWTVHQQNEARAASGLVEPRA